MKEFWTFAKDYQSGIAWVARLAVSAPLLSILLGIGPPWPSDRAVPVATSILQIVILMYGFQFWNKHSEPALQRRMKWCIGVMSLTFVGYLFLFSFFTFEGPAGGHDVKGFRILEGVEKLRSEPGFSTERDLLRAGNYTPENIWVGWTIDVMRPTIMVVWLGFFAAVASYIVSFTRWQGLYRKSPKITAPRKRKKSTKRPART